MEDEDKTAIKWIIYGIIAIIVFCLLLGTFTIVKAGQRGVVLNLGAFNGKIMEPGFNLKIPLIQSVKKVNVQVRTMTIGKSEAYSKDLQMVDIQSTINWNIIPSFAGEFYVKYNATFDNVLPPRLEASIKQIVAQYSAEELLNNRGEVQSKISDLFKTSVPEMVNLVNYSLANENFTPEYEKAIENKQIAQQAAEKANNDLKRVQIEAEQRIAQAKGEAEAIKIQAEAIQTQGGAAYVSLKSIEKWNGVLPSYVLSGSIPFISMK